MPESAGAVAADGGCLAPQTPPHGLLSPEHGQEAEPPGHKQ